MKSQVIIPFLIVWNSYIDFIWKTLWSIYFAIFFFQINCKSDSMTFTMLNAFFSYIQRYNHARCSTGYEYHLQVHLFQSVTVYPLWHRDPREEKLTSICRHDRELVRMFLLIIQLLGHTYLTSAISDGELRRDIKAKVGGDAVGHLGINSTVWISRPYLLGKKNTGWVKAEQRFINPKKRKTKNVLG